MELYESRFKKFLNVAKVMKMVGEGEKISGDDAMDITILASSHIKQILATSIPQEYINNKRAHVHASSLDSTVPPPSQCHHSKLSQNDKIIWDRAYLHEYLGLSEDTQTWKYVTEKEYQVLRPLVGNALPSMAVSTIKYDEQGNPKRAKTVFLY